ncbi:DUF3363 domain-containing protein [Caulobacter vibrioides]|uniref:DUF3363 domain-containing protein n=1 Tax=Caulobacter vibrioides TaxID=155892 RepID=A0A290MTR1_CAUVI|nr:DUF3363 domain-containing protein [Caulobacter vibrioides]ATC30989.1 DUF3363 domain-containing protein [Caulobacter vibrioides]
MDDHLLDFEIRPGRIRSDGRQAVGRGQRLSRLVAKPARTVSRSGGRGPAKRSGSPGKCSRIGRGQDAANAMKFRGGGAGYRRVVVKTRMAALKLGSQAAGAHLRYLVRDGVTRDGEPAKLYDRDGAYVDGAAFTARGAGDRRQFRFIVAPEDGADLSDMRAFTRDLMGQMERDLGTKLDWVAVDHFNTGHPHSHVVVRGKDEFGKDLIIAQDYLTQGLRHRAQELATLELGLQTKQEIARKREAQIIAERFTDIDRGLVADMTAARTVDMRLAAGEIRVDHDATLRQGRLRTLERMDLAEQVSPGVWRLSEDLESTLRGLGERGDIIRAMSRAVSRRGREANPEAFVIDAAGEPSTPKAGRVIDKRLTDELGDRVGLVVDGIDGRVRHVEVDGDTAADIRIGAIVETGVRPASRQADRTIAALAEDGVYRPSDHRERLISGEMKLAPGANADDLVEAHVRRLEALRRAGVVERWSEDAWSIPRDFATRAEAFEQGRRSQVRLLSAFDLESQIRSDGATWLDRRLVGGQAPEAAPQGFGGEVERALDRRREMLVRQGHATRGANGDWRARPDLLAKLERQEISRRGEAMSKDKGLPFRMPEPGEAVRGKLVDSVQMTSGKFAVIEGHMDFALVPWRPVMERYRGQEIIGTVEIGGNISWQLGRGRGLGI